MNRRQFLKWAALPAAGLLWYPIASLAQEPKDLWTRERILRLRSQETGEAIRTGYWEQGRYLEAGMREASWLLRDFHVNQAVWMAPRLLDLLFAMQSYLNGREIIVTSGYRTWATNVSLRGEGAAKNSMHLYGMACDLYVPGVPIETVGGLAIALRGGGVGYYPQRHFVHVDVGRIRWWS